jgi:vancomycin resistance protein VanW
MYWKTLIPEPARLLYHRTRRTWRDRRAGTLTLMAQPTGASLIAWPVRHEVSQPIMPSAFFENKRHNMVLAAQAISSVVIEPGQIFSFWAIVGPPTQQRGFLLGRQIVRGKVQGTYGGGLCQVSGIVYWLLLSAGLEVVERHNHSVDIYAEDERFTPLGTDATVVYGIKDLRLRNTLNQPIRIVGSVVDNQLTVQLCAAQPIQIEVPLLERYDEPHQRIVRTKVGTVQVARSVYGLGH